MVRLSLLAASPASWIGSFQVSCVWNAHFWDRAQRLMMVIEAGRREIREMGDGEISLGYDG